MAQFERLNPVVPEDATADTPVAEVHWVYDANWLCDSVVDDLKERGYPVEPAGEQSPTCHIDYGGSIFRNACFTHSVEEDGVKLTFWDHQASAFLNQLQRARVRPGVKPGAEYVKLHGRWYHTVIPAHVVSGLIEKVQAIVDASNRSAE